MKAHTVHFDMITLAVRGVLPSYKADAQWMTFCKESNKDLKRDKEKSSLRTVRCRVSTSVSVVLGEGRAIRLPKGRGE